jgi:hypothetical protein
LTEINLSEALISPDELTFAGLHDPKDWLECPLDKTFSEWVYTDFSSVVQQDAKRFSVSGCGQFDNDFWVEQRIFIVQNPRHAARVAEDLHAKIADWVGILCCSYEVQSVHIDTDSVWILRGNIAWETSYVVIVSDEAIIYIRVLRAEKLAQQDLVEVAEAALYKLRAAQAP